MSTGTYKACDMCGRTETGDTSGWGGFFSGLWVDGTDRFDLCPECAYRVQRFIRGHKEEDDDVQRY